VNINEAKNSRRQVTLVAFYGEKPQALADIIGWCQQIIGDWLGEKFLEYDLRQVHATIIGLERYPDFPHLHNLNFRKHRRMVISMDLAALRHLLLSGVYLPLTVQLGGFSDRDYPFISRSCRPFLRSFSIQGDKAVMMGWPIRGRPLSAPPITTAAAIQECGLYPPTLDQIRGAAQAFGVLHEYHRSPGDVDNDFYFRIGLLKEPIDDRVRADIETNMRVLLATRLPLLVDLPPTALSFISYRDNTLPLAESLAWRIADADLADADLPTLYG